jgi:hypothetical protein
MSPTRKNALAGRRSANGKLLVLRSIPHTAKCIVRCDWCRQTKRMLKANVRKSRSCGCRKKEFLADAARTHNQSRSPEYRTFIAMHQRCENPRSTKFNLYGGRGIRVARQFSGEHGFERFFEHVGPRPSLKHSIDRIETNGNYAPGNLRWATLSQQNKNRRPYTLKKAA